MIFV
ncbi:hypothetical protein YPPY47_4560, partial [Yersinia pestis PY-47]|jgi:hypothetical protein